MVLRVRRKFFEITTFLNTWFSDWFDNLGFITEGNTDRRCAASSLPLWGNTDVVLADRSFSGAIVREQSKGISGAVAGEDLQHIPGS